MKKIEETTPLLEKREDGVFCFVGQEITDEAAGIESRFYRRKSVAFCDQEIEKGKRIKYE